MTTPPAKSPTTPSSSAKESAPIRPAASVVILRDGRAGIEVFMLERHEGANMAFSGALVFPGGKVDKADGLSAWNTHAPATPAKPDRPFWIAAIRETFEEAGFLLARVQGAGTLLDAGTAHKIVKADRKSRIGGLETPFVELIAAHRLTLAVDQMIHFGHWITPPWAPRRFDTHFFLVAAPVTQRDVVDEGESKEGLWVAPQEALAQANAGKRTLVPVTRFTLELLASWPSVSHAVEVARQRPVVTVEPRMEKRPEGRFICIPSDAGYLSCETLLAAT